MFGKFKFVSGRILLALLFSLYCSVLWAQDTENVKTLYLKFTPAVLNMDIGDVADVKIEVVDENGVVQNMPFIVRVTGGERRRARNAVEIVPRSSGDSGSLEAKIRAHQDGSFNISVRLLQQPEGQDPRWDRSQHHLQYSVKALEHYFLL